MITDNALSFSDAVHRASNGNGSSVLNLDLPSSLPSIQSLPKERGETRKQRACRPIAVEVCGSIDDPCVKEIVTLLRQYCRRYSTILRMISTLFTTPLPEKCIFSEPSGKDRECRTSPLCTAPMWAVTANFSVPVIERFHPEKGKRGEKGVEVSPSIESADSISYFEDVGNAKKKFHDFMAYQFFPLVLSQIFVKEGEGDVASKWETFQLSDLIFRHYVHETTRTGSFLVADFKHRKAVLVDPLGITEEYESDIAKFSLELVGVFVTHCFVDVRLGVDSLKLKYPRMKVWSGVPWKPAGTTYQVNLSENISFVAVSMPSFSPENLVIELHVRNTLVAIFTGTSWSTDAAPRADLFSCFFLHSCAQENEVEASVEEKVRSSISIAYESLSKHFRDRYFSKCSLYSSFDKEKVLILPSHGGYNNVTGQLDLYWGCFLGDILRAKHSRKILDTLSSLDTYTQSVLSAQSLPFPLLFRATRWANLTSLWNAAKETEKAVMANCGEGILNPSFLFSTNNLPLRNDAIVPFVYPKTDLLFLDCREYTEYHNLHIRGSACIPMTFPATDFNALKAELWLQSLLVPGQSVVALCSLEKNKVEVKARLELISPDAIIHVVTVDELIRPQDYEKVSSYARGRVWVGSGDDVTASHSGPLLCSNEKIFFFSADCATRASDLQLPTKLEWVRNTEPLYRLDTHQKLKAADPRKVAIVVDVRTPPEFKNGSHQYCIPFPLSAMCELSAQDHLKSHRCPSSSLSSTLMKSLQSKFYHATKNDPSLARILPLTTKKNPVGWKEIIFYCAAGYRSLIAISLFLRAFEASYRHDDSPAVGVPSEVSDSSSTPVDAPWSKILDSVRMFDIPGGALQLLTERPDLWQVKDRSIICIS